MSVFTDTEVDLSMMRDCQKDAAQASAKHFADPDNNDERQVLLQLPTGTGKSALIAALPFCVPCTRVLVLVPNLGLVTQIVEDLDVIDHPSINAYTTYGLLSEQQLEDIEFYTMPLTKKVNRTDISQHNIIVANYHKFQDVEKWFGTNKDLIDLIIIDEAHHQAAKTYQEIMSFFDQAKVIGLTATPFRSDGQLVAGKNIYTYHFSDAVKKKYIRNIEVNNVSPSEVSLYFTEKNSTERYTLDQIINDMKEQAWFNREIALSQECCNSIADLAVEKLNELRAKYPDTNHEIIAAAISIRHAREYIMPAFLRHNLRVGMVSSDDQDRDKNDQTKADLRQGKLDVIISVGMLGEGFNQRSLGVAAIFRPYKTLNPYIQFIGRVLRENGSTPRCHVVSHLGLNQVKRFEEFKLFDSDDKDFLEKLFKENGGVGATDTFVSDDEMNENDSSNQPASEEVILSQSDDMMEAKGVFVNDDQGILDISKQYNKLNEDQRAAFLKSLGLDGGQVDSLKPKKIKPIQKRLAKKAGLNEKAKSITTDTLKALGLKPYDRNFNPLYKNFAWVQKWVNKTINTRLGIKNAERNQVELERLEELERSGTMEAIKQEAIAHFQEKLSTKT